MGQRAMSGPVVHAGTRPLTQPVTSGGSVRTPGSAALWCRLPLTCGVPPARTRPAGPGHTERQLTGLRLLAQLVRLRLLAGIRVNDHRLIGDPALRLSPPGCPNTPESVFEDPERFDITRSPNPHVRFGSAGPNFCLGAHLARHEITAVLRELLTRVPDIRAAAEPDIRAAAEPDYLLPSFINGIKRLPCEFG
jgi:hypothetical protein